MVANGYAKKQTTMYINEESVINRPMAYITKNKGRLKTYGPSVYLKNGSNFEIELYNPTKITVLAKIWINGSRPISDSGIVLKPGQRVFLERFIDDNQKFKFNTYEVEDTQQNREAISENGRSEVSFYNEIITNNRVFTNTQTVKPYYRRPNWQYLMPDYTSFPGPTINCYYNSAERLVGNTHVCTTYNSNKTIETGMIEKGEMSNQNFDQYYGSFETSCCSTVSWKILPESMKPIEPNEIRNYCPNCGCRQKKSSWKFCPSCGTKIEN